MSCTFLGLILRISLFFTSFSVPRPNMDKYVFLKVLEDQQQVMIDPEYVLLIQKGGGGGGGP